MGYALAAAAMRAGARGDPDQRPGGPDAAARAGRADGGSRSAGEMAAAVDAALDAGADWLIMTAAVADFTPAAARGRQAQEGRAGRRLVAWTWSATRTSWPRWCRRHRGAGLRVVGFALETERPGRTRPGQAEGQGPGLHRGQRPDRPGVGLRRRAHQVTLLGPGGVLWESESLPKSELAARACCGRLAAARDVSLSAGATAGDASGDDRQDRGDLLTWVRQHERRPAWFLDEAPTELAASGAGDRAPTADRRARLPSLREPRSPAGSAARPRRARRSGWSRRRPLRGGLRAVRAPRPWP